jgi:purine-nucleoside phosphorylase
MPEVSVRKHLKCKKEENDMETFVTIEQINRAAGYIRSKLHQTPKIGLILGSGLADIADEVEEADVIPYEEIPDWPLSHVIGHKNRLVVGKLAGQTVAVMQGRIHFYEGYNMSEITMPVRVLQRLGMETMVVTNAAGAINPEFIPGDVMLITDTINLICMTGNNPLRGPNLDQFGTRFPDMSQMFDRKLEELARIQAKKQKIILREGVYAGLSGPSFESPADLRFLHAIGADAVGMSTVPETIVARHGGVRVLGFSGITNKANLDGSTITTHEEVLEAAGLIVPKLKAILLGVLAEF